jgi:hypothetical protein
MEDRPQWTFQQYTQEKEEEAKETKDTKESSKEKDTKEKDKDMATTMTTATKGKQAWQPVKGTDKGQGKNKGANNQGKGKNPMAVCYRCGQPRHLAKDCKTAVYNLSHTTYEQQHDNTAQWYYRITQTMATMPAGTAVTKQAITRTTVGNNTSSPNKHHNLR